MSETYLQRLAAVRNGFVPQQGPKEKKPLKAISDKKAAVMAEEKKTGKPASKIELDLWFDNIRKEHFGNDGCACMECGSFIPVQFARHATAHLLPKKLFKSVATHPENYMILGAGCGCHVKTDRVDLFVKMSVWPEAARRIKEMLPLLPFDELKYLSSQLMAELDKVK